MHLLQAGETGSILEIGGESHLVRRLGEMGLHAGMEIRMVQPGHPCIVAFDHRRLSFRGEAEAVVLVEVVPPCGTPPRYVRGSGGAIPRLRGDVRSPLAFWEMASSRAVSAGTCGPAL